MHSCDECRLEEYNHEAAKAPHYPDAYLESKHTQPFAHWRTPKGVRQSLYHGYSNTPALLRFHVEFWSPYRHQCTFLNIVLSSLCRWQNGQGSWQRRLSMPQQQRPHTCLRGWCAFPGTQSGSGGCSCWSASPLFLVLWPAWCASCLPCLVRNTHFNMLPIWHTG